MAGQRRSTEKPCRLALDPAKAEKIKRELAGGTPINATARKLKVGVGTGSSTRLQPDFPIIASYDVRPHQWNPLCRLVTPTS